MHILKADENGVTVQLEAEECEWLAAVLVGDRESSPDETTGTHWRISAALGGAFQAAAIAGRMAWEIWEHRQRVPRMFDQIEELKERLREKGDSPTAPNGASDDAGKAEGGQNETH